MKEGNHTTRRAFVAGVVKKTTYVAPAVLALQAAERAGADYTGCVGPGSACADDPECCSNDCRAFFGLGEDCATSMFMFNCRCV